MMLKALVLAVLATVLFFAAHLAVFVRGRIELRFRALLRIAVACVGLYLAAFWVLPDAVFAGLGIPEPWRADVGIGWRWFACGVGLLVFAFVFLGYLEYYFTADRSITIRILREVMASQDGSLSVEEFKAIFETEEKIFLRRFREMTQSGYLCRDGDRYRNTAKGERVARMYDRVIRLLHLEGG